MDPRSFLPCFPGPRALRSGHKRKEKTRSITCRTDQANEANKRYVLSWTDLHDTDILIVLEHFSFDPALNDTGLRKLFFLILEGIR